ncbi:winged helix-turn-helix domain-containing protein [Salinisphaera sp. RV14]|uniref:winged helix-turn-helix domain-containing protein n=1 Tax=Salinisphaera sp. RV14 TaxID=3454140 RepID=UPI003F839AFF
MRKILLIEDDPETADYVARGLRELGHTVDIARDGAEGLFFATEESGYALLIVDRMLPRLDGLAIVKTMRDAGLKTPVLFLTTMGGIDDRVEGLEAGGDDYLTKPFAFAELAARVQALARRPPLQSEATILQVADLTMDIVKRRVWRGNQAIELQPREFRLLEYLMRHAGEVVTRTMLLEHVWDFHFEPRTSVVETHISRLRAKIDRGFETPLLHTVRGAGYSIHAAA